MRVIHRAPPHRFVLPNGNYSAGERLEPAWVVELLDGNMRVEHTDGVYSFVRFGVAWDRCIKPISDEGEDEDYETDVLTVCG
ncbi:MAG: hypothetical protein RB191_22000 [Terriglobia bacterium]|nr:hypothetical protein [Terriglobia bacterium]